MKELYRFRQFLAEGVIKEEQYSGAIIRKGSSDKAKEDTKIVRQALKKAGIKFTNRGEFGMNFKDADLAQIKKVIAGEKVGEFVVSRDVNEGVIKENITKLDNYALEIYSDFRKDPSIHFPDVEFEVDEEGFALENDSNYSQLKKYKREIMGLHALFGEESGVKDKNGLQLSMDDVIDNI